VPEALNGIFAFAIWDSERRRALLARDRLGVKPLYYAEVDGVLLFGSELKAVLASGLVPTEIDLEAMDVYLSLGFVPGPRTLLRHVKKLLPGHRIVVEPPAVRVERYWRYPEPAPITHRPEEEWREQLLDLLDDAVAGQLMSDVPLGAMLSGGLDSSLVVALMARRMSRPVKTFSVGFAGASDNELDVARATARALGAEHHELELSLDDPVDLEALIWSLDEPVADLSSLGFSALAALTVEHVTVALSGQGADELLAGYDRYRQIALIDRWASAPLAVRRVGHQSFVAGHTDCVGPLRSPPLPTPSRPTWRRDPSGPRQGARARLVGRSGRPASVLEHALSERLEAPPVEASSGLCARRAAEPRRRHAPLLRSDVDGALTRGSRPLSRSPPGRVLLSNADEAEGEPRVDQADPAVGCPRSRSGPRD
jgi:asparagine synthase (glutamine-hydrolysing)